jgi:hypothetical protein
MSLQLSVHLSLLLCISLYLHLFLTLSHPHSPPCILPLFNTLFLYAFQSPFIFCFLSPLRFPFPCSHSSFLTSTCPLFLPSTLPTSHSASLPPSVLHTCTTMLRVFFILSFLYQYFCQTSWALRVLVIVLNYSQDSCQPQPFICFCVHIFVPLKPLSDTYDTLSIQQSWSKTSFQVFSTLLSFFSSSLPRSNPLFLTSTLPLFLPCSHLHLPTSHCASLSPSLSHTGAIML